MVSTIKISFPASAKASVDASFGDAPGAQTGFSVTAQGTGSFTGLSYTVPAHTRGRLTAVIQVMAISSEDVQKLNALAMGMLSASAKDKIQEYSKTTASADLSFWSFISGSAGASASTEQTRDAMHSLGLTSEQIDSIIDKTYEVATKMTHVELDFEIDNTANDYSVSGDLQLYTISGQISTTKGTTEYRLLANQGTAGSGTAPAAGKVISLS